jgi:hypothetical protein
MTTVSMSDVAAHVNAEMQTAIEAKQGDLALLAHPVARDLLQSRIPARLAYVALDGTPRVVPVLFHWTGEEVVLSAWPDDPKVAALASNPAVAVTIDSNEPPFNVLSIRGTATVTIVNEMPAESLPAFTRYVGPEQGRARVEQMNQMSDRFARIAVGPTWVGVLDFETRFPSGMARRMSAFSG